MTNLSAVLEQLKEERAKLDRAIQALSGVAGTNSRHGSARTMSLAARRKIAAAQRARWAKARGSAPKSRTLSLAARRRIAAAQRARWAKVRAKKAA